MLILVAFSSLLLWLPVSGAYEQAVELFHHARFQSVIEVLDQLPASEASRPAAQNLRSLALMNLGKFETALIANSVATEQDPENPNYVYNRGLIQSSATQLLDAEQTFRSGVQRFPKSLRLNEGLGDVLFKLNRFAEAEQALKIAVEIDPARGSTLAALAKLYYALGDQERFAITAQRAIQADPSSYLACYVYGKYLL